MTARTRIIDWSELERGARADGYGRRIKKGDTVCIPREELYGVIIAKRPIFDEVLIAPDEDSTDTALWFPAIYLKKVQAPISRNTRR